MGLGAKIFATAIVAAFFALSSLARAAEPAAATGEARMACTPGSVLTLARDG